jgi:hypothetical protein
MGHAAKPENAVSEEHIDSAEARSTSRIKRAQHMVWVAFKAILNTLCKIGHNKFNICPVRHGVKGYEPLHGTMSG